jgi:KDO2-lipid IV(A) lauroyltransferase
MLVACMVVPLLWVCERIPFRVLRGMLRAGVAPLVHLAIRARCDANLILAFGDEFDRTRRRTIVRQLARNLTDFVAETLAAARHGEPFWAARIDDTEARARLAAFEPSIPHGYIGLTGHIGNWELLAAWSSRRTRGMGAVIGKRLPNPYLNRIVERLRRRFGLDTYYRDESPTLPIRLLRAGRVLGVVPDQDVKLLSGMFVDFFGRPAYTPTGPARLALAAQAPIVCAFLLREGDRFRVVVDEPIRPRPHLPRGEEIARLTREWSRRVEAAIRAHPEQWAWFHDRWSTTPEKLEQRGRAALDLQRADE